MKVLFLADVANVAQAGEVKEVADGYGRNYLLPRGLAVLTTIGALKQQETLRQAHAKREVRLETQAEELAQRLSQTPIAVLARVGRSKRLYGSITSSQIAQEIQKLIGHPIDKRNIRLEEPIKHLGTYQVPVKLTKDTSAIVTLVVHGPEGEAPPKDEAPQEPPPTPQVEEGALPEEAETT